MYRPTVRYDESFRTYVDELFHATHLDRNQIIRGALFAAAHSQEFQALLKPYQKRDVPLSPPPWSLEQDGFWLDQCLKTKGEGGDVNVKFAGTGKIEKDNGDSDRPTTSEKKQYIHIGPAARRGGAISSQPIKVQGGLVFTLN